MTITHLSEALVARQAAPAPDDAPIDFSSNGPQILAVVASLTGISALLVALRCYVRIFILRRFYVEDAIMVASLACAGGVLACFVGETQHGLGQWVAAITANNDWGKLSQWLWWHAIVIVMGISLVKISIGFFLLRFASQNKPLKKFIIGSIVFLVLFTIACMLTLILQCLPIEAAWDFEVKMRESTKCYSNSTYLRIGQFNSTINILTDFLYATLPVFMFHNVQVNRRTKASLMGILSLGYFACAAAIAKTVLQARVYTEPEFNRNGNFLIWNNIELNVGIIAACFPTIKPLVKSIIGSTRGLTYGSRSRKRTGEAYYGPSSHALTSIRPSRIDPEEQKYHVQIHANHPSLSGSDNGSEENLAAHSQNNRMNNARIVQTTEVIVHSEDGSDLGGSTIGPRRTVEDRI